MPRIGARGAVALLLVAFAFYLVLLGERAVRLLSSGQPAFVLLGLGVAVFPVLGAVLVADEVRLGRASARLGERLHAEGALPPDTLPRRPSGRVERDAADAAFAERRAEVEASAGDWRAWYRLALAYGDAGDKSRGRAALKHAVRLERAEGDA